MWFNYYFQELFITESKLVFIQLSSYLASFPHLKETEAAGYKGPIIEIRSRKCWMLRQDWWLPIQIILNTVALPLAMIFNAMKQENIHQHSSKAIVKLLHKNKYVREGMNNFYFNYFKYRDWAKILANWFQEVLEHLIVHHHHNKLVL